MNELNFSGTFQHVQNAILSARIFDNRKQSMQRAILSEKSAENLMTGGRFIHANNIIGMSNKEGNGQIEGEALDCSAVVFIQR